MLNSFKKILGDSPKRKLKKYELLIGEINALEPQMETLSDMALREKTTIFKGILQKGKTIHDIKVEAFAVVREAAKRVLGLRHYDTQLIGGLILLEGNIVEMPTGEGKTLTSSLPTYVRALEGKGVHVITVNEYLAKRDKNLIGQIHEFLGLQVELNIPEMEPLEKKHAYGADITYGTGAEFALDYLRDNMQTSSLSQVQRPYHFAIIDEIDNILIDEAKAPFIITGQKTDSSKLHYLCAKAIKSFQDTIHYTYDAETKSSKFTHKGITKIQDLFHIDNLYNMKHQRLYHYMTLALYAYVTFQRDIDYIVHNNKIMLIDMFTRRVLDGRSLSNGLHQAIAAKEGLKITEENQTQASITLQNFFRMYPTLSGMTSTAEKELNHVYGMDIIPIPTNRPIIREDAKDLVYMTADNKYNAVREEVMKRHAKGQPILIETRSTLQSEVTARYLDKANLSYQLLHAKSTEQEAAFIAKAGQKGQITIATNMAGRGTDILLEDGVPELGGLHVIGTERHESRRVDNQLKGRAGRQGDPGSSQFFLSLEDDMFQRFAQEEVAKLKKSLKTDDNGLILTPKIHDLVNRTQLICEGTHLSIREYHVKLDDVIHDHRHVIYKLRNRFLREETSITETALPMIEHTIDSTAKKYLLEEMIPEEWNFTALIEELQSIMPIEELPTLSASTVNSIEALNKLLANTIASYLDQVRALHDRTELEQALQQVGLHSLDQHWANYLDAMHNLKEAIELRQYQQEDPIHIYQREGLEIFLYTYSNFEKEMCLYIAQYLTVPQSV
ncbi:accessory Sec system translocase SecA2 [Bacillus pfraonensis]|uniref:accessory Sec system translocase SecA2 n=1 Tax=Bacillus TaxID=1386 RepID=UPI002A501B71|nr:accessory Sec system translocase SecA2 [Bacillus pseudomycoides]